MTIGLKPIEPLLLLLECPRLPYQQGKAGQNCLLTVKEKLWSSVCFMCCLEYTWLKIRAEAQMWNQFSDTHPDTCLNDFSGVTVCARELRNWEIPTCNTEMEDFDRSRDFKRNSICFSCTNSYILLCKRTSKYLDRDIRNLTGCGPGQSAVAGGALGLDEPISRPLFQPHPPWNTNAADRLSFWEQLI